MKKLLTIGVLALGIVVSSLAGAFMVFAQRCDTITEEVLRLHIPANSNSIEDQMIKLRLRDFILEEYGDILEDCETLAQAQEQAEALLPQIERSANDFLRANGFSYNATAQLVTMNFPTREYDRLILPAGEYRALRITLGSGDGENWWCVIFPQLCLPAVSDGENAQEVLSSFGKPQKVTVKFAVYEAIEKLFSR